MNALALDVNVAAPAELVWHAWTRADRVTHFFAPKANLDLRVGGAYELFWDLLCCAPDQRSA